MKQKPITEAEVNHFYNTVPIHYTLHDQHGNVIIDEESITLQELENKLDKLVNRNTNKEPPKKKRKK